MTSTTGSTHPTESHSTPGSPVRQRSLWLKAIGVGLIVFLLASCSALVFGVVTERHQRARAVEYEVTSTWGPRQIVGGPLLYVLESPGTPASPGQSGSAPASAAPAALTRITDRTTTRQRVLPRQLDWQATAEPEIRRRGLYPVLLYRAKLHGSGFFAVPAVAGRSLRTQGIELAFGSLEGIQSATITLDGATRLLERLPVDGQRSILWADAEIPLPSEGEARVPFEVEVELHGSGGLSWLPLATETSTTLRSSWPSPSFGGARLPSEHQVDDAGFTATWGTSSLQRAAAETSIAAPGSLPDLTADAFGAELILTASPYQRVERSVKYALLLIVLVFATLFVLETLSPRWLHPVHYGFVGADLCLFFLLLLALSEHLGFAIGFAAAAIATIASCALYARSILGAARPATILTIVLSGLFGFVYVLLSAETYALVLGAAGLFALLATAMYTTRRLDWYDIRSAGSAAGS